MRLLDYVPFTTKPIDDFPVPDAVANFGDPPEIKYMLESAVPIHVLNSGAKVRLNAGRIRVEVENEEPLERPIEQVSSLQIYGWTKVSSATIAALTQQGSPVIWRSPGGYPLAITGTLSPASLAVRRAQYAVAASPALRIVFARQFVVGKIRNMRGLLRRRIGNFPKKELKRFDTQIKKAGKASNLKSLYGIEGYATALYFGHWQTLLGARAQAAGFSTRNRRPPTDILNAALSYLYSVLLGECCCALASVGLDLREGFLHETRAGRSALGLDHMETFRPLIVDAVITGLINRGEIADRAEDAETSPRGYRLSLPVKKKILRAYEKRLSTSATLPSGNQPWSWREHIQHDAANLAKALRTHSDWQPIFWP